MPHPRVIADADGSGAIEAYTVVHGRDGGAERGVAIARLADGARCIAVLPPDRTLLDDLEREEGVGRRGRLRADAGRNLFLPS